jgi:hypothetical protein
MVYFQTKIPISIYFGGPWIGKCWYMYFMATHLAYFIAISYILWPFGNFLVIRYIFPHFGALCQEKSGNHDSFGDVEPCLPSEILSSIA